MISEDQIPDNWSMVQLGELGRFRNGKCLAQKDINGGEYPVYGANGQTGFHSEFWIEDDCIAIGRVGSCGELNRVSKESWVSDNAIVFWPSEVSYEYVYYFLSQYDFTSMITKAAQPLIRQGDVKEIEVPLPPVDEQEDIVREIEERLNAVEALEQSVAHVEKYAMEYDDSLLTASLSGQEDMAQETISTTPTEDKLPAGWAVKPLSEVAEVNPRISLPEKNQYAYLPMRAINAKHQEITEYERREDLYSGLAKFEDGDILVARITPCFENGKMAVVNEIPEGYEYAVGSSELVVIRPTDISPEYLFEYLKSPVVKQWGEFRMLGATGRERVKVSQFKNELMVPVPPEPEQPQIVENVNEVDTKLLRRAISNSELLFDEIRESILSHAFRGSISLE